LAGFPEQEEAKSIYDKLKEKFTEKEHETV